MQTCVISQPRLFPGLHYLHRMMVADVFVIFDSVQFNPRHEENRAKLKTARGPEWLTIPMRKASREQLIQDTFIDDSQPWQRKAWSTIQHLYGKRPHFDEHVAGDRKNFSSSLPDLGTIGSRFVGASSSVARHHLPLCLLVGAACDG